MFPVCDGFQESEADLAIAGPGSSVPAGCRRALASAWKWSLSARVAAGGNVIESPLADD